MHKNLFFLDRGLSFSHSVVLMASGGNVFFFCKIVISSSLRNYLLRKCCMILYVVNIVVCTCMYFILRYMLYILAVLFLGDFPVQLYMNGLMDLFILNIFHLLVIRLTHICLLFSTRLDCCQSGLLGSL